MKFHLILILLNLFMTFIAHADSPEHSTLNLIEKGTVELRQIVTPRAVCKNQTGKICSFKDFCKEFEGNETKETLYENELGERIVNGQFMVMGQNLNNCKLGIEDKTKSLLAKQSIVKLKRDLYAQAKSLNATDDLIQFELTLAQYMADAPDVKKNKEGHTTDYWIRKAETDNHKKLPEPLTATLERYLQESAFDGYKVGKKDLYELEEERLLIQFSEDPYVDPLAFSKKRKAKDLKFLKDFKERSDKVNKVFEETRARVIKFLEKNRTADNSIEIDSMIERVKIIRMSENPHLAGCPNAAFNPDEYKISICPNYYVAPELTLMKVLGHEITHSIDPCNSLMLPQITRRSSTVCTPQGCTQEIFKDPLEKIKVIKKNPFSKTISCLKQKNSVWAMSPDDHVYERHEREREHLRELDQKETLAEFESHLQSERVMKDKFCSSKEGNSQLGESFSDWLSGEVIGEKVAELENINPASAAQRAKEALMVFPTTHCSNVKKPFNDLRKKINTDFKCANNLAEVEMLESREDPHPFATARINKIFLAQPQIKKALKCSDDPGVIHCENTK